jgi:hypothetical protein
MIRTGLSLPSRFAALRTRLALGWLWWRHAYTFNVAHKPLCDRFRHNVWRVGSVHACRSCTLLYGSALLTAVLLLCLQIPDRLLFLILYGLSGAVVPLSYPLLYERFPRWAKDLLRCATGVVIVLMVAFLLRGQYGLGLLNIAVFAAAYRLCLREYRKWKLRACDGCPELGREEICSGFCRQAARVRAYETAAEAYLIREPRYV